MLLTLYRLPERRRRRLAPRPSFPPTSLLPTATPAHSSVDVLQIQRTHARDLPTPKLDRVRRARPSFFSQSLVRSRSLSPSTTAPDCCLTRSYRLRAPHYAHYNPHTRSSTSTPSLAARTAPRTMLSSSLASLLTLAVVALNANTAQAAMAQGNIDPMNDWHLRVRARRLPPLPNRHVGDRELTALRWVACTVRQERLCHDRRLLPHLALCLRRPRESSFLLSRRILLIRSRVQVGPLNEHHQLDCRFSIDSGALVQQGSESGGSLQSSLPHFHSGSQRLKCYLVRLQPRSGPSAAESPSRPTAPGPTTSLSLTACVSRHPLRALDATSRAES